MKNEMNYYKLFKYNAKTTFLVVEYIIFDISSVLALVINNKLASAFEFLNKQLLVIF